MSHARVWFMSQAVVPDTGDQAGRLGNRDLRLEPVRGGKVARELEPHDRR